MIYKPVSGKKQNVHTKQFLRDENIIEERKNYNVDIPHNKNDIANSEDSGIISAREKSVEKYSSGWQRASLSNTISRLLKNPEASPVNKGGKIIYSSSETTLTIVYDTRFDYFRIQDTKKEGELSYMDIDGNPLSNNVVLPNGKQTGRPKSERRKLTHFKNID